MAVITISRGSYTHGKVIAEKTAERLGYECISREVLLKASEEFDIPEIRFTRALEDAPSFLSRFSNQQKRYIAYIQAALLDYLKRDNVVYHGFSSHFFVKDISQILEVLVIAEMDERIKIIKEREKISTKECLKRLKSLDEQRRKWGRKLYGMDSWDPRLYDLVIRVDKINIDEAVEAVCRFAALKQFQTTPESLSTMADMALASQVNLFLVNLKANIEVCINQGFVTLVTESPVGEDSELMKKMRQMVNKIPDIKGVKVTSIRTPEDRDVCLPAPETKSTRNTIPTYFTELG
jgi:cytidylate kinase